MKIFQGISVFPGIAIGSFSIVANDSFTISRRALDDEDVPLELERLDSAYKRAQVSLDASREAANKQLGAEYGKIFEAHGLIMNDASLRRRIETAIREDRVVAEYAVDVAFEASAKILRDLQSVEYRDRANDIVDVKERLLRELLAVSQQSLDLAEGQTIFATSNLQPSAASSINPQKTIAIVAEKGGLGSHTAIVAAALRIPTVLGLGDFLVDAYKTRVAVVDGASGQLILDPTPEALAEYKKKQEAERNQAARRQVKRGELSPVALTADNVAVEIKGNIEFPFEAQTCLDNGAAGVGLYRTEFLYLAEDNGFLPDEETHFLAYKMVAETMGKDRTTTIRTFDLGADKLPSGMKFTRKVEPNPFMGLRSIRLSLRNPDMFRVQLRALVRASHYGKIAVMFPLVSTITEFRQAKMLWRDICEEFTEKGIPFDRNVPLGIMVETPATVIMLDRFATEVDFFSIGTNDLLQYAQAVDRSNEDVNYLYAQESPALIRLLKRVVEVAAYYGKPVSLCGLMGSDPYAIPLLLGLGLRSVSVAPGQMPVIKEICSLFTIEECEKIAYDAFALETADEIRFYLKKTLDVKCNKLGIDD